METYKNILVPLDGSDVSEAVLSEVEKLASALRAKITILRVAYSDVPEVKQAENYVRLIKERLKAKGFNVDGHMWYASDAAQAILEHSVKYHIDIIAMSTHGRTGLKHVLLGSVAEKVLHHTTIPVLLVRYR